MKNAKTKLKNLLLTPYVKGLQTRVRNLEEKLAFSERELEVSQTLLESSRKAIQKLKGRLNPSEDRATIQRRGGS